ncbi:MAG: hypothetical protein ACK55I_18860, partial [bacterium]
CGTGSAGGGCGSSARGRGLREATATPLRPPRGCCCHRPRGGKRPSGGGVPGLLRVPPVDGAALQLPAARG